MLTPRYVSAPALAETRFLVDSVVEATPPHWLTPTDANCGLHRILELLELVEQRQRALSTH